MSKEFQCASCEKVRNENQKVLHGELEGKPICKSCLDDFVKESAPAYQLGFPIIFMLGTIAIVGFISVVYLYNALK